MRRSLTFLHCRDGRRSNGFFKLGAAICAAAIGAGLMSQPSFAQTASNTTPVANQTTVTVNQTSTQSVISAVSSSVQASLAQATMAGIRMPQSSPQSTPMKAPGQTGTNSGDAAGLNGTSWLTGNYVNLVVKPDGSSAQRRLSDIYSAVGGGDVKITDTFTLGLAGAFTHASTDGRNTNLTQIDQLMRTYTVTPYFGWAASDHILVDGLVGYSYSSISTKDFKTRSLVSSNTLSHTVFAAVNVSYFIPLDAWTVKPFVGVSGQTSNTKPYHDSTGGRVIGDHSNHFMGRVGSQVSYLVTDSLLTYASAAYERESEVKGIGESSARITAGLEEKLMENIALNFEVSANVGRETQRDLGGTANIRFSF